MGADEGDLHPRLRPAGPSGLSVRCIFLLCLALCALGCGRKRPQLDPDQPYVQEGVASYYDGEFVGRPTASGEIFAADRMTAAHPSLPFGTVVRVTNLGNGRAALVTVNDRGPFVKNRILDLTRAGARELGYLGSGTARVRLEVVRPPPPPKPVWLQLGAFRDRQVAEAMIRRLRGAGAQVAVIEEDDYLKIRLGPYARPELADPDLERWRKQGLPGFLVQVN